MKYILFTYAGEGLPVAIQLQREGQDITVGIVGDTKTITLPEAMADWKPEKPEEKARRMSLSEGIIKTVDADKLLKAMAKIKDKEDYFVLFDFNCLFKYSEEAIAMGYRGHHIMEEDYRMEADRNLAKDFVKKNYTDIKVAEVSEFKKVEDALKFLDEHEETCYALKGGPGAETVVPSGDDVELNHQELQSVLGEHGKDYEKEGFILEQKIIDPIEITPELIFMDGVRVAATIDIENKTMEAGNEGLQVGCAQNLVFPVPLDSPIIQKAFPAAVDELAAKHKGLFVWDASLLIEPKSGTLYFGEFCASRWGYDSLFTELAMADSATKFFESIALGENPFPAGVYGAATRIFHLPDNVALPYLIDPAKANKDEEVTFKDPELLDLWMMDIKKDGDKYVTVGYEFSLACLTGCGQNIAEAVDDCYENRETVSLDSMICRPKFDFLSQDYPTSIINRYNYGIKAGLYVMPPFEEGKARADNLNKDKASLEADRKKLKDEYDGKTKQFEEEKKKLKEQYDTEISKLKEEVKQALQNA